MAMFDDTDCDDTTGSTYPNAEYCNGIDDDCNSISMTPMPLMLTWYQDSDTDSYGNASVSTPHAHNPMALYQTAAMRRHQQQCLSLRL